MKNTAADKWNERYSNDEFAYGEEGNVYLQEQLQKIDKGSILFPAEGEGRNAVYAAVQGWNVSAFDISIEGKNKAMQLAKKNNVQIEYSVGFLDELKFKEKSFDVIALIYAHFPAEIKSHYHKILNTFLKNNGIIIFEAFSKKHLEYNSKNDKIGGPKELGMLFSIEELKNDFPNYEVLVLEEKEIELHEGLYHNGLGSVIRFVGRKVGIEKPTID